MMLTELYESFHSFGSYLSYELAKEQRSASIEIKFVINSSFGMSDLYSWSTAILLLSIFKKYVSMFSK